ncbi:MAG: T9SS type A sorting domain-containing protein, partial [Chitinophagales bacterium]
VNIVGVGLAELEKGNDLISLFPNPADEYIVVQNEHTPSPSQEGNVRKQFSANVYDLNGKLIDSFNLNPKLFQQKIDVSGLTNGIYFVKFTTGN